MNKRPTDTQKRSTDTQKRPTDTQKSLVRCEFESKGAHDDQVKREEVDLKPGDFLGSSLSKP